MGAESTPPCFVSANYTGAECSDGGAEVATPIETQVNGNAGEGLYLLNNTSNRQINARHLRSRDGQLTGDLWM